MRTIPKVKHYLTAEIGTQICEEESTFERALALNNLFLIYIYLNYFFYK